MQTSSHTVQCHIHCLKLFQPGSSSENTAEEKVSLMTKRNTEIEKKETAGDLVQAKRHCSSTASYNATSALRLGLKLFYNHLDNITQS